MKKVYIALFTVIASISLVIGITSLTAKADQTWSDSYLESTYVQGQELTIANRTVTLDDGTVLPASITITLPDGSAVTSNSLKLDQTGNYKVKYTALHNGVPYFSEQSFMVKYSVVKYSSGKTSVKYGSHNLAPNVFGLVVRLSEGDVLEFNQIIDLNGVTINDSLITLYVSPDFPGAYDFRKLYFKFTDIEDPENYLTVRGYGEESSTYVAAAGNGQTLTGLDSYKNILHVGNNYGFPCWHAFTGMYYGSSASCGATKFSISYEYATKCVYGNKSFVVDLDNAEYFSNGWDGFKSGKVKLSVWADVYKSETANFVITSVKDMDIAAKTFEETTPPEIIVNSEYPLSEMPNAKKGVAYPVPTATAKDEYDGECAVTTNVYYNYKSGATPIKIQIKDGKFIPNYTGDFAIVYESSDVMGNISQQIAWVNASNNVLSPEIKLTGSVKTNAFLGDWVTIPDYEVNGGTGNKQVKITVSYRGAEQEIIGGFRPEQEGTYTVKINAVDYIGQKGDYEYTVMATKGTVPIFVDTPTLPKYFIAGSEYLLADLYANDYTGGSLVRRLATVKVRDINGERVIEKGQKFIPSVSKNFDNVRVTYECNGVTTYRDIPTVIAWIEESGRQRLHIENYFDLTNASIEKQAEYSVMTATGTNSKWTFANAQLANNFDLRLNALTDASYFDGFKVTYTDFENHDVNVSFTIIKNGGNVLVATNGESKIVPVGFTNDSETNEFSIGFNNGKVVINGVNFKVDKQDNGDKFNGFESNKIYVTVEALNSVSGAKYEIVSIAGYKVNTSAMDRIAPNFYIDENRGGVFPINEVITLKPASFADVVDPNTVGTVTIKLPDGKIAKTVDGATIKDVDASKEYTIKVDMYGQYIVTYTISDVFNATPNSLTYTYAINVEDEIDPEIVLMKDFVKSVKVGGIIIIPQIKVNDNVSSKENIILVKQVLTPSGYLMTISEECGGVKAVETGVYKFQIFAIDEAGNINTRYFEVIVSEA